MFDDVMTLNEADNPTKDCHPEVRHIFPVRYALSESFLSDAYNGKRNSVATPISIDISVSTGKTPNRNAVTDHQLRRLREGYVYVFYNIGASQPIWRQFQSVWPNNKSESDRYGNSTIYGFRDCAWVQRDSKAAKNGQDLKGYTLKDHNPDTFIEGAVQDFIDIPQKDVTQVWIGYAPAPWPEKLLKAIQDNKSVRSRFMSEINVENENGPNIMPFEDEESWRKIADFVGPDAGDPFKATLTSLIFNRLDPLLIDHEASKKMRKRLCKDDQEKARIVALRDDLGEAEQIAHLHSIFQESYLSAVNDNKYATQIGTLARAILKEEMVDRKYFRDDFETRLNEIEENIEKKAARCRGPVQIQNYVLERTGDLSSAPQIDSALAVYNLDPSNSKAQDVYEYACYLTGLATLGMSNSEKGIEVLQTAIKNSPFASGGKKMAASDFRTIFNSLIGASAKATNAINTGRLKCFEIAVTQHTATFLRLTRTDGGYPKVQNSIDTEKIARIFNGGDLSHGTVKSPKELAEKLKMLRKKENDLKGPCAAAPYDIERKVIYAERVEEIKPSARFSSFYRKLEMATGIANGASLFCGALTLTSLLRQDTFSEDDQWNIVATLSGLIQDFIGIRSWYFGSSISTSQVVSLLTRSGGVQVTSELTSAATTAKAATGIVGRIGAGAGVLSAVVSVHFALKGLKENDSAAWAGNMLMAAGSVLMVVGTACPVAMVVGIICVAVGFIISFFQLSKLEKWAAGCFWGNGPNYIYWDDWQRGPKPTALENTVIISTFSLAGTTGPLVASNVRDAYVTASMAPKETFKDQMERSYALGRGDDKMKEYFESELTDFKELTVGMRIVDIVKDDSYADLLCDAIQTKEDCEKVEVSFFVVRRGGGTYNSISPTVLGSVSSGDYTELVEYPIPVTNPEKELVKPGHMKLKIKNDDYLKNDDYVKEYGKLDNKMVNDYPSVFHIKAKFTAPSTGRTITASSCDDPIFRGNPDKLGWHF